MKTLILAMALLVATDAFAVRARSVRRFYAGNQLTAPATVVNTYTVPPVNPNIPNSSLSRSRCLGLEASAGGQVEQGRVYVLELIEAYQVTGGGAYAPSTTGVCYAADSGIVTNTWRLDCRAEGTGTFCEPSQQALQQAQSEYERRFGGADGQLNYTYQGQEVNIPIACMNAFSTAQWLYGFNNHCLALAHVDMFVQEGCGLLISQSFAGAPHPVLQGQSHALNTASCPQYNP